MKLSVYIFSYNDFTGNVTFGTCQQLIFMFKNADFMSIKNETRTANKFSQPII